MKDLVCDAAAPGYLLIRPGVHAGVALVLRVLWSWGASECALRSPSQQVNSGNTQTTTSPTYSMFSNLSSPHSPIWTWSSRNVAPRTETKLLGALITLPMQSPLPLMRPQTVVALCQLSIAMGQTATALELRTAPTYKLPVLQVTNWAQGVWILCSGYHKAKMKALARLNSPASHSVLWEEPRTVRWED